MSPQRRHTKSLVGIPYFNSCVGAKEKSIGNMLNGNIIFLDFAKPEFTLDLIMP